MTSPIVAPTASDRLEAVALTEETAFLFAGSDI
jgi:hypothetical protein